MMCTYTNSPLESLPRVYTVCMYHSVIVYVSKVYNMSTRTTYNLTEKNASAHHTVIDLSLHLLLTCSVNYLVCLAFSSGPLLIHGKGGERERGEGETRARQKRSVA